MNPRELIQWVFWAIGIPLQILVIANLVQGAWRRFTIALVYTVLSFLATVMFIAAKTNPAIGKKADFYYWANEIVLQILVFLVVISLIYQATEHMKNRTMIARYVVAGAMVIAVGSILVHYQNVMNYRMTLVVRDLSFFSAILDLGLWSTLIASRNRDRTLLMLSGGLGLQFSGEALGQSLRDIAKYKVVDQHLNSWRPVALVGTCIAVISNLICLYVWWQALRQYNESQGKAEKMRLSTAGETN